jgi:hypothetical protein
MSDGADDRADVGENVEATNVSGTDNIGNGIILLTGQVQAHVGYPVQD